MPSNYTPNPSAVESPSAPPGGGAAPTLALPVDADAMNSASTYQPWKVLGDYAAQVAKSLRPTLPVLAASGSGFTAVSYSSFGGTVTPSGSVKIATGTSFQIKIIVGGAVGTATFQTSMDGGNTFGSTQTTAASMTDATSGITLAFAGTLTINGTASFQSAVTPQAAWLNSAGNTRFLIDHNGFPMSRLTQWAENWGILINAVNSTTAPLTNYGQWQVTVGNGAGTNSVQGQSASSSYPAPSLILTPGTNASDFIAVSSTMKLIAANATFLESAIEFEFSSSAVGANSVNWDLGWWSAAGTPAGGAGGVYFEKLSTDTNWQAVVGTTGGPPRVDTGVPPVAGTMQRFRIEVYGSASPFGAQTARFFINEALVNVTAATMTGPYYLNFYGSRAAANSVTGTVGAVRGVWNRWADPIGAI